MRNEARAARPLAKAGRRSGAPMIVFPPKPTPPVDSWWARPMSRDEFSAEAAQQAARISGGPKAHLVTGAPMAD